MPFRPIHLAAPLFRASRYALLCLAFPLAADAQYRPEPLFRSVHTAEILPAADGAATVDTVLALEAQPTPASLIPSIGANHPQPARSR